MYSDTECSRRMGSVRSFQSSSSSHRYVRGYGSNQDLSKRPANVSPPSITEIIYNNEMFSLFADFLKAHGRESLSGFCAFIVSMSRSTSDKRQAVCVARAAFSSYINNESISNGWLQPNTREFIRQQIHQHNFDPYHIFDSAMNDMLKYLKQNFYANFLSSSVWKNYLSQQQILIAKRKKFMNASSSTPKKFSIKQQKQDFLGNQTVDSTMTSIKTRLACFIQNNDVPYMIYLNKSVEHVTLVDIKSRIHSLAGKKLANTNNQYHYYFKRRIDPSEMCLMNDGKTLLSNYVYEEIDSEDISTPVPHIDGTIVCKFDFTNIND